MRATATNVNHAQPGDPSKAADVILEIASLAEPPLRIQLGRDSFSAVTNKLALVAEEQRTWHEVSISTDYDDVAVR